MGMDVTIYAIGPVTDDELAVAVKFFADRDLRGTPTRFDREPDVIEIDMNGARFYGEGYERGPWPEIATNIMATVAAFPQCHVEYGGDALPGAAPPVTEESLADLWAHYFGPNWDAYRRPTSISI